jgi:hypothetical protein
LQKRARWLINLKMNAKKDYVEHEKCFFMLINFGDCTPQSVVRQRHSLLHFITFYIIDEGESTKKIDREQPQTQTSMEKKFHSMKNT